MDIRPDCVTLRHDDEAVTIEWSEHAGAHRSAYRLSWLRAHAYALNRADIPPPSNDISQLQVHADRLPPSAALNGVCLDHLQRFGAIIVRGAGMDTEMLIDDFTRAGLAVVTTHFGRIEDLRTDNVTNQNTDQLGYTDAPVHLHTDQPFLDEPPRFQMLHCMRAADEGGDSYIVDGKQAALYLRSLDSSAFTLLTTIPVRFHRKQRNFERLKESPVIELRGESVFRVRSSYFTMAPHTTPFDQMEEWYRAYKRFASLINDPRHQYRFRLEGGDFLVYDNYRMLHARTAFSGPRWVRGVYFR